MIPPPAFDDEFRNRLEELFQWRRDVRRFRRDPVAREILSAILDSAQFSPSVGNSQPWRIVNVFSAEKRAAIRRNFLDCNAEALSAMGDHAGVYARLKLEGLDAAPVQWAVFCDRGTHQGHGLGSRTMPEAMDYSVAAMIAVLWLAARSRGLGVGWVSIVDPARVITDLGVSQSYKFIAYLCLGWPVEEHLDPELARFAWQDRTEIGRYITHV